MSDPASENEIPSGECYGSPTISMGEKDICCSSVLQNTSSSSDPFAIDTFSNDIEMLDDELEGHLLLEKFRAAEQFGRQIELRNQRGTNTLSVMRGEMVSKPQNSELDLDSLLLDSNDSHDVSQNRKDDQSKDHQMTLLNKSMRSNLFFEAFLTNWENELEKSLSENLMMQRALLKGLECPNNAPIVREFSSWVFITYGMPYFKDKSGNSCPHNIDVDARIQNNLPLTIDFHNSGTWLLKDKSALSDCVLFVLKEKAIENVLNQMKQIESSNVENECSKIELRRLQNRVEKIKEMGYDEIASKFVAGDKFDWPRVSSDAFKGCRSAQECQSAWELCVKPSINKSEWTNEENITLKRLAESHNEQDWDTIATELGSNRSGYECFVHYQRELNKNLKNFGRWSHKEDQELIKAVETFRLGDHIPWRKIAYFLNKRTINQLRMRWKSSLDPHLKKGFFSKDEDRLILQSVEKFGPQFGKVASFLPNRSVSQIRSRFERAQFTTLKNKGRWSLQEDQLLMELVGKYGTPRWSQISKHFMTRTRTQVRQRYNHLKCFLKDHPELGIEDIFRSNQEKSEETPLVSSRSMGRVESILKNRKRSLAQKKLVGAGLKLAAYFQENCPMEALCGQQHWDPSDISSKANSIFDLSRLLKVDFSYVNNSEVKALSPYSLRQVVKKLIEDHGDDLQKLNDNMDGESSLLTPQLKESDIISSECSNTLIDCPPCKVEDTFYSGFPLVGSPPFSLVKGIEEITSTVKVESKVIDPKKKENFLDFPFLIPPNVASAIGFRSLLVIERKLKRVLDGSSETSPYQSTLEIEGLEANGNFARFNRDEAADMFRKRLRAIFGFPMILGENSDRYFDIKNLLVFKELNDKKQMNTEVHRPIKRQRTSPYVNLHLNKIKSKCEASSSQIDPECSLSDNKSEGVNSCIASTSTSKETVVNIGHSYCTRRNTKLSLKPIK